MIQAKFSLEESHVHFLEQCKTFGFKDKSEAVRIALDRLRQELETRRLRESAELYAQVYEEDEQLRELTESAILDWPS
jgi:Arc/MetJ-type ribon-helix-helix transcriptional regulator